MKRNFGLDVLRAFSIWLVLAQHGGINIPGLHPLKIGGIGVEIFFVLSGFLIGGILFRELDKGNSLGKTLRSFWVRRWFRILPLYYLVLLLKFIFVDHSIGSNILYYIFFLQNNFYGIHFLEVSWSLVIEEWFYLFAPFFLYLVSTKIKSEKGIVLSIVGFIVLVNAARIGYVLIRNTPYEGINSSFPFRFDSLFLGVLLAYLKHRSWSLFNTMKSAKVAFIGLFLFVGYIYYYWLLSHENDLINSSFLPRTLGFFILPFSVSLMVPYFSAIEFNSERNSISKGFYNLITQTSILTYAIYLVHTFLFSPIIHQKLTPSQLLNWAIALGLTYLIAWLLYVGFEKPILNYRDKIAKA